MHIYRLTNLTNGKIYIGQTVKTVEARMRLHRWSVNNTSSQAIHAALRKYGWNQFRTETIHTAHTINELNAMETFFIILHQSFHPQNGYNRNLGGYKRKNVGQIPWNKGTKGKQVAWNKGTKMSTEYRDTCRARSSPEMANRARARLTKASHLKAALSRPCVLGAKNPFYGKKHSEETRAKMRDAKLRFIATVPDAIPRLLSNLHMKP